MIPPQEQKMKQEPEISAADCLYPAMRSGIEEVRPKMPPGMEPHEYSLRQLYPSMYGPERMEKFYERWKDDWD